MAKDSCYARSERDKLYVWIAPPGWRPADAAARFPKQEYDPHRDFIRFDPPRSLALNLYVLVQLTVLIGANSHLLSLLPKAGNLAERLVLCLHPGEPGDVGRRAGESP
ncbi:hypothetical protein SBA6_140016 [Candidatus Sulfopaludibacter sp. SbA6]|nr:hypothetical protein SBA6_140016 [Candidatus Sulfopaludibacter sp. SbA6]